MKNHIVLLALSLVLFGGCIQTSTQRSSSSTSTKSRFPETIYYADVNQDGSFEVVSLDEVPVPFQGQDQWVRDFYTSIKYPPKARENGISGIVLLDVSIDAFGKVQQVEIKKSLSKECDKEAKRAFINSTLQGYTPAKLNAKVVPCRMDLPVGFWLN